MSVENLRQKINNKNKIKFKMWKLRRGYNKIQLGSRK